MEVQIVFWNGSVLDVNIPEKVELTIGSDEILVTENGKTTLSGTAGAADATDVDITTLAKIGYFILNPVF